MKILLPFFLPTQVLLIDDNTETLKKFHRSLLQRKVTYKPFSNPFKALDYINTMKSHLLYPKTNPSGESLLGGNIDSSYEEIFSPSRFQQISTVIVDYDMPGMNGIEFCQKIDNPHIQKILLTGAATEKTAVEAFNSQSIHFFLQKSDPDVLEKLENLVVQMQEKYFRLLISPMMNVISYDPSNGLAITDPVFIEFFHNLIREKNICEYYLLDSIGSTLFLSEEGEASALFMFDDMLLLDQEDMLPEKAKTPQLIDDLQENRKAICHYPFKDHPEYEQSQWESCLYPLTPLQGKSQLYYWAYVPTIPYLKKDKIISFKQYNKTLL